MSFVGSNGALPLPARASRPSRGRVRWCWFGLDWIGLVWRFNLLMGFGAKKLFSSNREEFEISRWDGRRGCLAFQFRPVRIGFRQMVGLILIPNVSAINFFVLQEQHYASVDYLEVSGIDW